MTTFAWLIIGHLIGDWVLQNDWMAKTKKVKLLSLGGIVHSVTYTVIITLVFSVASGFSNHVSTHLMIGAFVFTSHWLIDGTRIIERWMRLCRQSQTEMVRLMVDQSWHLIILAVVAVVAQ
jgi:hypothetical protein